MDLQNPIKIIIQITVKLLGVYMKSMLIVEDDESLRGILAGLQAL